MAKITTASQYENETDDLKLLTYCYSFASFLTCLFSEHICLYTAKLPETCFFL